jgi:SAM-dependent MidA family methyltransferase
MTDKETIAFMLDTLRSTREMIVYGCSPELTEYQKQVMKRIGLATAMAQDALDKPDSVGEITIYQYNEFEDWFCEIENYGTRGERFWESIDNFKSDMGKEANHIVWLKAAFDSARLMG